MHTYMQFNRLYNFSSKLLVLESELIIPCWPSSHYMVIMLIKVRSEMLFSFITITKEQLKDI